MAYKNKISSKGKFLIDISYVLRRNLFGVWSFPCALTVIFLVLVGFAINGSSIGYYHDFFDGGKDESLIFNQPRVIRSDEWIVVSPTIIGQDKNNYEVINENVGNGEDVGIIGDVPYREWSILFKPQNIGFFILPFDNAFALRWWFMSYVLMLSAYLFVCLFLPKKMPKRVLIAAILSASLFFSPFIQWWYLTSTIAPVAYSLLGFSLLIIMLRSTRNFHNILLGIFIFYIAACFCLVLYPPFQIPCALVVAVIGAALIMDSHKKLPLSRRKLIILITSVVCALGVVGLFLYQHKETVDIISNSAYPGHRVAESGTVSVKHFFANHLALLFTDDSRAASYSTYLGQSTNQSEASNFILLLPFTLVVILLSVFNSLKNRLRPSAMSLGILILALLFFAWLFIPELDVIGKITLLDKVPASRLLIGIGLLNFIAIIEAIRILSKSEKRISTANVTIISLVILTLYLLFNFYVFSVDPAFIGYRWAVMLAIPIPLIVFLLLRKDFLFASLILLLFTFFSTYEINPLYRGTASLRDTELSRTIGGIASTSSKAWVSENIISSNLIAMNGATSLSGTYLYPQNDIWGKIDPEDESVYNRYANVLFMFDRDEDATVNDDIKAVADDQFWVRMEACSPTLKSLNVGFILTASPISEEEAPCLELSNKVVYPKLTFFVYKIN